MSYLAAVLALAGTLGVAPLAAAADKEESTQPAPPAGQRGERVRARARQVADELNLTKEQRDQLRPLLRKEAQKLKTIRDDTSLTREQKREKVKAAREELAPEVKKVLTAEQFEKWKKLREQRAARPRPSPAARP